ncbi:putative F-box protein [Acanthamoeba polyphaga mimivirus]|uniref:F-box protein n=1 Tax=Acanthamoeba polyphaga mimivirus Kroon TaxID=3069720 RepID=A0A0G2Y9Q9_9VIRU|nr:putative F-box protein [Acanthamoeba polyphaga mimivirus]AKI79861.1 putative F-box protein [Acanthamoeba polyphaga mimivirus Kroon]
MFELLPEEMVYYVFCFLDLSSFIKCSHVCKKWRRISDDEKLWNLYGEFFGPRKKIDGYIIWRRQIKKYTVSHDNYLYKNLIKFTKTYGVVVTNDSIKQSIISKSSISIRNSYHRKTKFTLTYYRPNKSIKQINNDYKMFYIVDIPEYYTSEQKEYMIQKYTNVSYYYDWINIFVFICSSIDVPYVTSITNKVSARIRVITIDEINNAFDWIGKMVWREDLMYNSLFCPKEIPSTRQELYAITSFNLPGKSSKTKVSLVNCCVNLCVVQ